MLLGWGWGDALTHNIMELRQFFLKGRICSFSYTMKAQVFARETFHPVVTTDSLSRSNFFPP